VKTETNTNFCSFLQASQYTRHEVLCAIAVENKGAKLLNSKCAEWRSHRGK